MTAKRFIAGAVCPRCNDIDRIRAWHNDGKDKRYCECVVCGYEDVQSMVVQMQLSETPTRLNQPHRDIPEAEKTVINFILDPDLTKY